MKNRWRYLFLSLLGATIFLLILGPLILRIPAIHALLTWWLHPIEKYIIAYTVLFGATIASALTISGAMWQSEYNTNKSYMAGEKRNLKYLLMEIEFNADVIDMMKQYVDKNKIEKIFFYPEANREIWSLHGGQEVNVSVKNNRGILHVKPTTNKKFLMKEIFSYEEMAPIEELYKKYEFINTNNDLEYPFIEETYHLNQSVLADLSEFVSAML